jgi:hypothetical protein
VNSLIQVAQDCGATQGLRAEDRPCHAFLIKLFHNVSVFFVGILTDRQILSRIGEEIEWAKIGAIAVKIRFLLYFCWPFGPLAAIITPLLKVTTSGGVSARH